MSSFEDELRKIAPNVSQGCVTSLEASYGHCTGFCSGLDIFARTVLKNAVPKQIPVFGEPWKGIYADTLQEVQTKGQQIKDAYMGALSMKGRPALELFDAIRCRVDELNKAKPTGKKDKDDYLAELKVLGYDLRLNLCGMHIEVNGKTITDYDDAEIRMRMEDEGYKGRQRIQDAILTTAKENEYHPIKDYLNSLKWDGIQRIEKLAGYFNAQYVGLFPVVLRKWLIGSIARIMDGDQNPMLVLEGPQGCGKGTFTRWLCPNRKYHRESSIDPDNKDHRIATSEIWIWEVGELGSTTKKADREALKSFLTTDTFTERAAYGRYNQQYTAMSSFIGTINDENGFLNDPTGSRRFWIMGIDAINFDYSKDLKPDDIWAEAMAYYKAGEGHDLTDDQKKTMTDIADEYKVINATEEAIKKHFDITNDPNDFTDFNTIREVLQDPARGNLSGRDLADVKIASALKDLGLERDRKYVTQQALGHNKSVQMRGYVGLKPL